MSTKSVLTGWIAAVAQLLLTPLENAFPPLAAIGSSIVSAFSKAEANAILNLKQDFVNDLAAGKSWEETFTDMLNKLGTEEFAVVTAVGQDFLKMFAHKAKG